MENNPTKIQHVVFDHDGTLVDVARVEKSLFPEIKDLILWLKSRGVKLYVWTARSRYSTVEILKSLAIISEFEDLSCSTDAPQKPSPEGIRQILDGVDPKTVCVIGDSVGDMIGGSKFGATCIGALWAHNKEEAKAILTEYGADYCAMTVAECKEILNKNI